MLKPITELPPEDLATLRREIGYNPETGAFTRTSNGRQFTVRPSPNGYLMLDFRAGERRFAFWQHRAAFFIMLGTAPALIDHEDGNRANNRWKNIRESDHSRNNLNRHVKVGRDQGLPVGIYERTRKGRPGVWFECKVEANGKRFSTYRRSRQSAIDYVAGIRRQLSSGPLLQLPPLAQGLDSPVTGIERAADASHHGHEQAHEDRQVAGQV